MAVSFRSAFTDAAVTLLVPHLGTLPRGVGFVRTGGELAFAFERTPGPRTLARLRAWRQRPEIVRALTEAAALAWVRTGAQRNASVEVTPESTVAVTGEPLTVPPITEGIRVVTR